MFVWLNSLTVATSCCPRWKNSCK